MEFRTFPWSGWGEERRRNLLQLHRAAHGSNSHEPREAFDLRRSSLSPATKLRDRMCLSKEAVERCRISAATAPLQM
jgi:hypothetical protein